MKKPGSPNSWFPPGLWVIISFLASFTLICIPHHPFLASGLDSSTCLSSSFLPFVSQIWWWCYALDLNCCPKLMY